LYNKFIMPKSLLLYWLCWSNLFIKKLRKPDEKVKIEFLLID